MPYEAQVLYHATDKQTGEQMAVAPGNGTDGWIASMYDIGQRNHRRNCIELHNEMMVDEASLERFEFESITGRDVATATVARRLREEA
jgi:hypothetical protein